MVTMGAQKREGGIRCCLRISHSRHTLTVYYFTLSGTESRLKKLMWFDPKKALRILKQPLFYVVGRMLLCLGRQIFETQHSNAMYFSFIPCWNCCRAPQNIYFLFLFREAGLTASILPSELPALGKSCKGSHQLTAGGDISITVKLPAFIYMIIAHITVHSFMYYLQLFHRAKN